MSNPDVDREENLSKFMEITQMPRIAATEIMIDTDWDLDMAVQHFYTMSDADKVVPNMAPTADNIARASKSSPQKISVAKPKQKTFKPTPRIATIGNTITAADSDEEEGEAYYQGGSERSGQQIIGQPNRDRNIVDRMFKSARDHGAVESNETRVSNGPSGSGTSSFSGSGYRLSDTATPSGETSAPSIKGIMGKKKKKISVTLKLWKDGFSLDNGPERSYKDPENHSFLRSIKKGEVPDELLKEHGGEEVDLSMEDHRDETFVKPKSKVQSFSGPGNSLLTGQNAVRADVVDNKPLSLEDAHRHFPVDPDTPTTILQIRLVDGSTLRETFNQSRTISDVTEFIRSARPQYSSADMYLMTTHPNVELQPITATLAEAKLFNTVVVQRIRPKSS